MVIECMRMIFYALILFMSTPISAQIYSISVNNLAGEPVPLSRFKGKVLLIVNSASTCAFTPQYKELQELYEQYRDKGLEILAFPSNDFNQEAKNGAAIAEFCSHEFHVTFPVFDKIHVKGADAAPLYRFLTDKKQNGRVNAQPRWNFYKYLVDREGRVVNYFYPFTKPSARRLRKAVEKLL